LEESVKAAHGNSAKMVVTNRRFLFESEDDPKNEYYRNTVKHLCDSYDKQVRLRPEEVSQKIVHYLTASDSSINFLGEPPNVLLHRDVFGELGMFDVNLIQSCDYEFWSRVGSNHGVVLVPEVLSEFRIHSSSTTRKNEQTQMLRTKLDLPAVLIAYLYNPEYRRFRDHIGEKGIAGVTRYAMNLLRRLKAEIDASGCEEDKQEWIRFCRAYPVAVVLINEPSARAVAAMAKKYVTNKFNKL